MTDNSREIQQARVDIPLRSTCAYLFVEPSQSEWDPWWGRLYEYLLGLSHAGLAWRHEPIQDVFIARPHLTDEQRRDLIRFFQTAPATEIEGHRTLRRAVELTPEQQIRVDVMYFSKKKEHDETDL